MSRPAGRVVLVNDRVDVAFAAGAAGVHLPGRAVAAARIRPIAPASFLLGRSVHSVDDARQAESSGGCDYLVFGTVFETAEQAGRARACRAGAAVAGLRRGRAAGAGDWRGDGRPYRRDRPSRGRRRRRDRPFHQPRNASPSTSPPSARSSARSAAWPRPHVLMTARVPITPGRSLSPGRRAARRQAARRARAADRARPTSSSCSWRCWSTTRPRCEGAGQCHHRSTAMGVPRRVPCRRRRRTRAARVLRQPASARRRRDRRGRFGRRADAAAGARSR